MVKLLDPELVESGEGVRGGRGTETELADAGEADAPATAAGDAVVEGIDVVEGWPLASSSIAILSVVVAVWVVLARPLEPRAVAIGDLATGAAGEDGHLAAAMGFPTVAAAFTGEAAGTGGGAQPPQRIESSFYLDRLDETRWVPTLPEGLYLLPGASLDLVGFYRPHGSYATSRVRPMLRSADGRRLTMQVDEWMADYYWTDPAALEDHAREQGDFLGVTWPEELTLVTSPTAWLQVDSRGETAVHYSKPLHPSCETDGCEHEYTRVGRVSPRTGSARFHAAASDPSGGLGRHVLGYKQLPERQAGSLSIEIGDHPVELESSPRMVVTVEDSGGEASAFLCLQVRATGMDLLPVLLAR